MTPFAMAVGAVGILVLGLAAWRRWLSPSGLVAAGLVGIGFAWGLGAPGLGLLVFFFVTSSALTKVLRRSSRPDSAGRDGAGRSAGQVFANAGVATIAAVYARAAPGEAAWIAASAGGLAAATADTWASEVGEWKAGTTLLITSGRRVDPGTNGGVSWPGSSAAVVASVAVGGLAALVFASVELSAPVAIGGIAGMLADSIAGATVEDRSRWLGNDTINWLGTLTGAAVAMLLAG